MKIRDKNPILKGMIRELCRKGSEEKTPFWTALARSLNRPRRKMYEVSITRIEKNLKEGETAVVPGVVLSGEITKPLTIAALRFTKSAKEKIEKAGGKCMSIEDIMKSGIKNKKVRIMG